MDANGLTLEYLAGIVDAARKKKLAKEAGLLEEELPAEAPVEGEGDIDPSELEALLAAVEGGEGAPPAEAEELPAEVPPEVPPEEEEA